MPTEPHPGAHPLIPPPFLGNLFFQASKSNLGLDFEPEARYLSYHLNVVHLPKKAYLRRVD